MDALMLLLICIIIIICLISGIYMYLFNRLQDYIVKINEVESIIDTNLRNKYDNLNKCVSIIKGDDDINKKIDKKIFEEIIKLRNKKISNFDLDRKLIDANNEFMVLKQKYPKLNDIEESLIVLSATRPADTQVNRVWIRAKSDGSGSVDLGDNIGIIVLNNFILSSVEPNPFTSDLVWGKITYTYDIN